MSEEDAASRAEAESFERRGDEMAQGGSLEEARTLYRQSQHVLLPVGRMWSDAEEYDLRMAAFQRVQEKLWALASSGLVRPGTPVPVPERAEPRERPQPQPKFGPSEAARQFEASMVIGYEQWHDGIGYDLDALARMSEAERQAVEAAMKARVRDGSAEWRDIEALTALDSPAARQALRDTLKTSDLETQLHAARALHAMGEAVAVDKIIVAVLKRGGFAQGTTLAFDMAPAHATPYLRKAMLDCARNGDRSVRVHAAAMCLYLAGQADAPFDWAQRPFFLQFGEEDRATRERAFAELKRRLAAGRKTPAGKG